MCSGSEAGSYFRRTDFEYHSNLGLRVIKKKKKNRNDVAGDGCRGARACRRVEPLSKIGLCLVIHKPIYVHVQVMVAEGPGRYNMLRRATWSSSSLHVNRTLHLYNALVQFDMRMYKSLKKLS